MEKQIIIDLGCGENIQKDATIGIDWREIPQQKDKEYVQHNLFDLPLPFPDKYADKIYLSHVLEHFPRSQSIKLLNDVYRILKDNGIIRIDTPNIYKVCEYIIETNSRDLEDKRIPAYETPAGAIWSGNWYEGSLHCYGYSDITLRRLLSEARFDIIEHNGFDTYALIVTAKKKKLAIHQYPLSLVIELTNRCNLKCPMCGMTANDYSRKECDMEWELFTKIAGDAIENNYRIMWLHVMGEPLLSPIIIDAVQYIYKKSNQGVCISTNGTLLSEKISEELIHAGVDTIQVALPSMQRDVYEIIKNGANFDDVKNNIHNLCRAAQRKNIHIVLQMLRTYLNPDEDIKEYIQEFGYYDLLRVEQVDMIRYSPNGKYIGCNPGVIPGCLMREVHFTILSNGDVPICCIDYNGALICGNMKNDTINDIAVGKSFCEYVQKINNHNVADMPPCNACLNIPYELERIDVK